MLSIDQLMKVATKDQVMETILSGLTALGFNARSWHVGGVRRTMLEMFAQLYANSTSVNADLAKAGFNDTATGPWLDVFSQSHYKNQRKGATATTGYVRLTASANAPGPFTVAAGDLVFTDEINGLGFRNTTGGTLIAGDTLDVEVLCDTPGAIGDVAPNTITIMRTPLAGVTASNPTRGTTGTWIIQNGADEESDPVLQERNRTKWATLAAVARPGNAYVNFAMEAHASVRRVNVDTLNPRGPGTIDVWLAGDAGPVAESVVDAVWDYMDGSTDGIVRNALGADVEYASAVRFELPLRGTVYIRTSYNTTATQLAIVNAIRELFKTVPVGGVKLTTSQLRGHVPLGEIFRVVLSVAGVQNLVMISPTSDYELEPQYVAVPSVLFGYVSV